MISIEQHILGEFDRLNLYYKAGHREIRIRCPWHGGWTLDINRNSGLWKCWNPDCRREHNTKGGWDKLADRIGAGKLNLDNIDAFGGLASQLDRSIETISKPTRLPVGCIAWDAQPWRGISGGLLQHVNAQWWYDDDFHVWRVLLPVILHGVLRGWVARRITGTATPWRNNTGMDAQSLLYPFDLLPDGYPVVALVEGAHDALRLWQYGIPTLCCFGAGQWRPVKRGLLLSKGVHDVIVIGDGDKAGRGFRKDLEESLCDYIDLWNIELPFGEDPGSIDETWLSWIYSQVERLIKGEVTREKAGPLLSLQK